MNKIVTIFFCALSTVGLYAQRGYYYTDSLGKQGIFDNSGWISEYKDDVQNGICLGFDKVDSPRKLRTVGMYENDIPVGTWIYFDNNGNITLIIKDIKRNDSVFVVSKKYSFANNKPNYMAYMIEFYPTGIIKQEGPMYFDEDFNGDDSFCYGEWKYYNENGVLIKTEWTER